MKHISTIKKVSSAARFGLTLIISLTVFFPFFYMISMSLRETSIEIFQWPPKLLGFTPHFSNYAEAAKAMHFFRGLKNTLTLLVCSGFLQVLASLMCAYGFARFDCKANSKVFYLMLSTMMLPWIVLIAPRFVLFKALGWIGTLLPLIAPSIGGAAYNIFLLVQFIKGIPRELDEAAKLDGASTFRIYLQILIPNMMPIITTLVIFAFTGTWNDYTAPSIYITKSELYTLALSFNFFKTGQTSNSMQWHYAMAGCVLYALPVLIVFFFAQNVFMRGVVTSGIKE